MSEFLTSAIELFRFETDANELFKLQYDENSKIIFPINQNTSASFVARYGGQICLFNQHDTGSATIIKNGEQIASNDLKSNVIDVQTNDYIEITVFDGNYGILGSVVLKNGNLKESFQSLFSSKLTEVEE